MDVENDRESGPSRTLSLLRTHQQSDISGSELRGFELTYAYYLPFSC
jgi:hypothetical protein